jgi:hypothetical protein
MFQTAQVTTREDTSFDTGAVQVPKWRGRRRWLLAGGALLLIVLGLAGTKFFQIVTMIKAGKAQVTAGGGHLGQVEQVEWQPLRPAVGR